MKASLLFLACISSTSNHVSSLWIYYWANSQGNPQKDSSSKFGTTRFDLKPVMFLSILSTRNIYFETDWQRLYRFWPNLVVTGRAPVHQVFVVDSTATCISKSQDITFRNLKRMEAVETLKMICMLDVTGLSHPSRVSMFKDR